MEKSSAQIEKNVTASFAYVKKDILMLNDSYTNMQDVITQLANSYKVLADEIKSLKNEMKNGSSSNKSATSTKAKKSPTVKKKKAAKKASVKKKTVTKKKAPVKKKKASVKKKKADRLSLIEGVGPAIEKILKKNNIKTFKTLGKASVKNLRDMLEKAGPKFRVHEPASWPKQARLAAKGDMITLGKLQEELQGGRKVDKKAKKKVVTTTTYN